MNSHCMLDLETFGTKPGCIVLSISAIKFDPSDTPMNVIPENSFSLAVNFQDSLNEGLKLDPSTVAWWLYQQPQALGQFKDLEIFPVRPALQKFSKWFLENHMRFVWCQGASFDAPILERVYEVCKMSAPWKFYDVRDTRTVYQLAWGDRQEDIPYIDTKNNHVGIYDAFKQVNAVQFAVAEINRRGTNGYASSRDERT